MGSTPSTENPQPKPSSLEGPNIYEKTGYDPESRWRTFLNIYKGRLTPHGQYLYAEDMYHKREASDCKRCDEDVDYLLAYSPIIRFLSGKIEDLNGGVLTGGHTKAQDGDEKVVGDGAVSRALAKIKCERCITRVVDKTGPDGQVIKGKDGEVEKRYMRKGGGFSPEVGILICANEVRTRSELEDAIAHEMVHAWDHLRWKVDWGDLRHAACSEIRASTLSGECRWTREFFSKGNWAVTQQFQNCVRRRAAISVAARPNCKDDVMAAKVVNEVFESCFNDTRPFDEVYK